MMEEEWMDCFKLIYNNGRGYDYRGLYKNNDPKQNIVFDQNRQHNQSHSP